MTCLLMIVAQFAGAMFGVLLGFLALTDRTWMNDYEDRTGLDAGATVPNIWLGLVGPQTPGGKDLGLG